MPVPCQHALFTRVRDETAEMPRETGVRSRESPRHTCDSMSRGRAASPPGWPPLRRGLPCRSGISAVAVEVIVNNAG